MRVISLNTGRNEGAYLARLESMAKGLEEIEADIIVLQECFATIDGKLDTALALASALRLPFVHDAKRRKLRDLTGQKVLSTSGFAVLTRFPVESRRTVSLSSDMRDGDRHVQIVDLATPTGSLRIVNVHFTYLTGADGDDLRWRQWVEMATELNGMNKKLPIVIAGDFNCAPTGALIRRLAMDPMIDLGLQDARAMMPTFLGGLLEHKRPPVTLDYIAVMNPEDAAARCRAKNRWVTMDRVDPSIGTYSSDHAAIVADIELI